MIEKRVATYSIMPFLFPLVIFKQNRQFSINIFIFCRKNPIHFQQFSHPNDDDYHETDTLTEGNDDNRPECPYGTACYR